MKKVYIAAAVLAVISGLLIYGYLNELDEKYREDYRQVVIAAVTIPENTLVTQDMITLCEVSGDNIHSLAALKPESVVGGISAQKIYQGEQILKNKIKKMGEYEGKLSYSIPEGMRAVSMAVDVITGTSGFIRSGDHVDLIVVSISEDGEELASLLLENVEVLAIGTDPDSRIEDFNTEEPVSVITLLTTPADAVKLNLGVSIGKVTAVLRSPADQKAAPVLPVSKKELQN